ncbi:LysR family transcriptional regulator [Brevibacterium sp. CBA3109]|uniref:LysR family transcriptional regulator n=1 Tax=Brevibacterium koreense TaxID=3140787 RepID=A0AAU7UJY8_9MICO
MNIDHVKALAAVVDEGTVEGGAFVLGVTPSATSQRIRTLESRIGQVLIRRTNPITVTEAGEAVLKYAREVELLESETMDRLHGIDIDAPDGIGKDNGEGPDQRRRVPTVLRIGVNADSLSTWFRPIFAEVAGWDDIVIRIEVADQDAALPLLTSGRCWAPSPRRRLAAMAPRCRSSVRCATSPSRRRDCLRSTARRFVPDQAPRWTLGPCPW